MSNPTDPGAEMKARASEAELNAREFREHGEWQTTVPFDYAPVGESRWEDRYAAAFAAKEVARAIEKYKALVAPATEFAWKPLSQDWRPARTKLRKALEDLKK